VIADTHKALQDARLYLVCDAIEDARLDAALRGGVGIVQLRCKTASDEEILTAARRFARLCGGRGVPLILNDRPDLVAPASADGVHVGQDDVSVSQARALVGPARIVGLSTHTPAQIDAAGELPLDYIGVGPVNATPTKPGRPAVGTELVAYAAAHARSPFFAIGGVNATNACAVAAAGASRLAVVRAITEATDPRLAAAELVAVLAQEAGVGAA
jgi:thiamine-phosphate pyrophosphorylase